MRIRTLEERSVDTFDYWNRSQNPTWRIEGSIEPRVRKTAVPSQTVAQILAERNLAIGNNIGAKLAAHLAEPESIVIIGGQQPGAFGGPLLVHAKLAALSNLAAQLQSKTKRRVLPIFWVHSEDHDLDEVNQVRSRDGFEWKLERLSLTKSGMALESTFFDESAVSSALSYLSRNQVTHIDRLQPRTGESWAEWSTRCLQALAGDPKVIFFEPQWTRHLVSRFFAECIEKADQIDSGFREGTTAFEFLGFKSQLRLQENGQLFRLSKDGRRTRLLKDGSTWNGFDREGNPGSWSTESLIKEAIDSPESFSTNAVTRPLLQQWLFDPMAQISGPAESAYLKQIEPVFSVLGLAYPIIFPRSRILVLPEHLERKARNMGLNLDEILRPRDDWPWVQEPIAVDSDLEELHRTIGIELGKLGAQYRHLKGVSIALTQLLDDLDVRFAHHRRRVRHRWEQSMQTDRGRRRSIAEFLYPGGKPQERLLNPLNIFGSGGLKRWPDLLACLDPYEYRLQVLQ